MVCLYIATWLHCPTSDGKGDKRSAVNLTGRTHTEAIKELNHRLAMSRVVV